MKTSIGFNLLAPVAMCTGVFAPMCMGMAPDHVVVVIEENRAFQQIVGSPKAPYFNELAQNGAVFSSFYGLTHPSQPNYLHLFSGSHQGIFDNELPALAPFATPNLGARLIAAGHNFIGYSEDLPAIGFLGRHIGCVCAETQPVGQLAE